MTATPLLDWYVRFLVQALTFLGALIFARELLHYPSVLEKPMAWIAAILSFNR